MTRAEILDGYPLAIDPADPIGRAESAADLWLVAHTYNAAAGLVEGGDTRKPILRRYHLACALALAAEGRDQESLRNLQIAVELC